MTIEWAVKQDMIQQLDYMTEQYSDEEENDEMRFKADCKRLRISYTAIRKCDAELKRIEKKTRDELLRINSRLPFEMDKKKRRKELAVRKMVLEKGAADLRDKLIEKYFGKYKKKHGNKNTKTKK